MRTENESPLDLGIHFIGHDKSAQDANRLLFQLSNSSRKNVFSESTPTDGGQGDFPSQQRFGRLIMPPETVLSLDEALATLDVQSPHFVPLPTKDIGGE